MDPSRTFSRHEILTGADPMDPVRPANDARPAPAHPSGARRLTVLPTLPDPRPTTAPPAFHLLVKPRGAICNLDCTYCFFLSKEALYPDSRFRMEDELLDAYVRQLLESHVTERVTIAWQGGEPTLMGLPFYERLMERVARHRRPGQVIEHTIQTNGTLIDEDWARFFATHGFLVGLSMDGPPDIHDAQRVDKGGAPTHAKVLRAARLLADAGADFNILCTVHALNGDRGREVYRYFRDEVGATFIQFIPIVERATPELIAIAEAGWGSRVEGRPLYTQTGDLVTSRSVGPEQWGRFLIDVFEEWVRRDVGRVFVQMFDVTLANFVGAPPGLCVHSETCGNALAMEHNGDVYSCDHFVEPGFRLGNIAETHLLELVASPQQRAFGRDKRDSLPSFCLECDVRFACHGGCPKDRFREDPYGEPGLNYLCAGYKAFFGHVTRPMRHMESLLRNGRAAAEIMRVYALEDAVREPSEPCSCRSGRAFADCHGDGPLATREDIEAAISAVS